MKTRSPVDRLVLFQPEEEMLWVSYFWQLPGGSPMEGFVNIFDEDTFEEKNSFESFSSNQNKDFVNNNIYLLVQQK